MRTSGQAAGRVAALGAVCALLALPTLPAPRAVAAPASTEPAPAPADPQAPWRRLERIGVSAGLRHRCMEAAEVAAGRLVALQRADGTFVDVDTMPHRDDRWGAGINALAAWALAAHGSESAAAAATRTADWLAAGDTIRRPEPRTQVYTAGATLGLLLALGGRPSATDRLARDLAGSLDVQSGYWGYHTPLAASILLGGGEGRLRPGRAPNLSTSQFAVLGLLAAEMAGAPVPAAPWRGHLETLVARQTREGSWPYELAQVLGFRGGTFTGIANLHAARDALRARAALDAALSGRAERAAALAADLLEADGPDFLWDVRHGPPDAPQHALLTALALQSACAFSGEEHLAGAPWADPVMEAVLARQNGDGTFGAGTRREFKVIETAIGILVLGAAPAALVRAAPPPGAPEPSGRALPGVPVGDTEDAVTRLVRLLGDRESSVPDILATLDFLGRAVAAPDASALPPERREEAVAGTRRAVGEALLAALVTERPSRGANLLAPVNVRAARVLERAEVPADPRLLPILRRGPLRDGAVGPTAEGLRAVLGVAAARAGPAALPLLLESATDADPDPARRLRARAALQAIPRVAGLDEGARRDAAERLVRAWRPAEDAAGRSFSVGAPGVAPARWAYHRPWVLDALDHLVRDRGTGGPLLDARGLRLASVAAYDAALEARAGR